MTISKEQEDFRNGKLGASDVASALGHNPYKSKAQLYGQILGLTPPFQGTLATRVGEHMEPLVLHEVNRSCLEGGTPFVNHGETVIAEGIPWLICHPDGMRIQEGEKQLLEIKNVGPRATWNYDRDGTPPIWTMDQCLAQSFICGIPVVYIASYHGGNDLRFKRLEFNKNNYSELEEKLFEFWHYVENKICPPVEWNDAKTIQQLHPTPTITQQTLVETKAEGVVSEYLRAKDEKKKAEQSLLKMEATMKQTMADTEELVDDEGRVIFSYKNEKRGSKTNRVLRCKIKDTDYAEV